MSDKEMVLMIRVMLTYVEDIHRGGGSPSAKAIKRKLETSREKVSRAFDPPRT
jgi:hypothetical protein